MLSQLEQACKTYSTKSSSGLIEFGSNWQRLVVTDRTILLDQAIQLLVKDIADSIRYNCYQLYPIFSGCFL